MFMTGFVVLVMSSCHDKGTTRLWCIGLFQGVINKDISKNVIFALKMSELSEWHLMTVVTNMTSFMFMSC